MNPTEVLEKYNTYAVVGATPKREKFGYKIYKTLKNYHKTIFPVNPRYDSIDGQTCFSSISELPEKPEVVVSVVTPRVTDRIIGECKILGIDIIWMQPGTYNDETLQKCKEMNIEAVYGACIMLKLQEQ
ncbi:CoA-binding protein [candidate division WOR-3 bacterium]|nr:CoA-binding protein [candidate division WOR-3 bacterium]